MSIVDALEKAKRLRQTHEKASAPAHDDSVPGARSTSGPPAAPAVEGAEVQPQQAAQPRRERRGVVAARQEPINAPCISPDRDRSRESRVIEFGGDESETSRGVNAYRMLRTRLLQRMRQNNWVTIGVTSAMPDDGKSLTAINLACSFSRDRTANPCLLDLDLRNPSLCRMLGIEPPHDASDYFEGRVDVDDLFFSIGIENLILAAGLVSSAHASELLGTDRFEQLVARVKQGLQNPVILIDLPPLLATDDALVVAPRVDAILLVVAERQTSRASLARAMQLIRDYPIAGVVLNRSAESLGGGYGYDGSYGL